LRLRKVVEASSTLTEAACGLPGIVAGQIDVFPSDRRQVSQRLLLNSDAVLTQGRYGAFQIYGIPECNGRDDQIQAAGGIALVLEAAVA
jgi:hypothetical protein